jgi:hypothetical protein
LGCRRDIAGACAVIVLRWRADWMHWDPWGGDSRGVMTDDPNCAALSGRFIGLALDPRRCLGLGAALALRADDRSSLDFRSDCKLQAVPATARQ